MKKLHEISKKIESVQYELSKMGIFNYNTLDEADPKFERIRSDITVEIGGPSTHIKFTVLTRDEHTRVKKVVESILRDRMNDLEKELSEFCEKYLED